LENRIEKSIWKIYCPTEIWMKIEMRLWRGCLWGLLLIRNFKKRSPYQWIGHQKKNREFLIHSRKIDHVN
jgi:hypothetical protein